MKKILFVFPFIIFGSSLSSCNKTTYTVTWKNWDGTILEVDKNVQAGSMPEYNGDSPIRDDGFYDYDFKGWNHEIESVESDQEYIADYESSGDLYSSVTFLYIDITNDDLTFDFTSITPLEGKNSYVDWGDDSPIDNELSHTYSEPGYYTILVSYVEKIKCTGEESLNIIKLGDEVDEIEREAFKDCSNLKTVDMSESIKRIGKDAFVGCSLLDFTDYLNAKYLINGGNPFFALVLVSDTSIKNIDISHECKIIAQYAFSDCENLGTIYIPAGITCIDDGTFLNCNSLTFIQMANCSVTEFGDEAFKGCSSLINVDFSSLNLKYIGNNCFFECRSLWDVSLPDTLISIGDSAFNGCDITSIELPNNLESIGNFAFSFNTSMNNIVIPSSVKRMGRDVFSQCTNLKNIYCEAKGEPEGWMDDWNGDCDAEVHWGYTPSK